MKRGQAPKAMSYAAATSSRRPDDAATLWRLLRLLATLAVAVGVVVLPGAWRGPLAARAAALVPEGPRQVTFVNRMHQVIWAAASPGNRPAQLKTTGWVIPPGHSLTITVPGLGTAASGAGRRGATSTPRALAAARLGTAMAGSSARGSVPHRRHLPSTTAVLRTAWTFTTSAWSMARIYQCTSTGSDSGKDPIGLDGCSAVGCTRAVVCPTVLQVRVGGNVVGCISACARFGTDQYCCRGKWSSRSTCDPRRWPVDYAAAFKHAEPFAYSYTYDDATGVFSCYGRCNYRITFGLTS